MNGTNRGNGDRMTDLPSDEEIARSDARGNALWRLLLGLGVALCVGAAWLASS